MIIPLTIIPLTVPAFSTLHPRSLVLSKTICHKAKGDGPVEEFLDGLGSKQAQKVACVLQLVKELPLVPKQYFRLNSPPSGGAII